MCWIKNASVWATAPNSSCPPGPWLIFPGLLGNPPPNPSLLWQLQVLGPSVSHVQRTKAALEALGCSCFDETTPAGDQKPFLNRSSWRFSICSAPFQPLLKPIPGRGSRGGSRPHCLRGSGVGPGWTPGQPLELQVYKNPPQIFCDLTEICGHISTHFQGKSFPCPLAFFLAEAPHWLRWRIWIF